MLRVLPVPYDPQVRGLRGGVTIRMARIMHAPGAKCPNCECPEDMHYSIRDGIMLCGARFGGTPEAPIWCTCTRRIPTAMAGDVGAGLEEAALAAAAADG